MSVEEALGRMRLLLARRSVVARRLAAAADGPGEVRSPRLDGMPRGHGTRGGTLAVLGRMEALADECAEIEGELAGYMGLQYVLDEGYISNVCTAPEHRRRGVAGALIDEMISRARALGLSFLSLEVRVSNDPAISLYAGKGFVSVGVRPKYYEKPTEDAMIMNLALA